MPNLGNEARNLTIYIKQGSDWVAEFSIYDQNGNIVSMAGSSFAGKIKKTKLSQEVTANFNFSINQTTNVVTVSLTNSQTSQIVGGEREIDPASKYVYDWEWTNAQGIVDRIQEGNVIVSTGVT